jgi:DNA-binding MarR family transcriptional regulator
MKLKHAIELLSGVQKIDPDMPVQQLMCLFFIAQEEEGTSLTEIARKANIGLATASRYVSSLGKMNRHKEEGFNFVESYEDPMERRKKIIRLTTKGKIALKKILGDPL